MIVNPPDTHNKCKRLIPLIKGVHNSGTAEKKILLDLEAMSQSVKDITTTVKNPEGRTSKIMRLMSTCVARTS